MQILMNFVIEKNSLESFDQDQAKEKKLNVYKEILRN
jgi:hypothetical protein